MFVGCPLCVAFFLLAANPPRRQGLAGGCRLARRNGPFGSVAGAVLQANTGQLATAGGRRAHLSIFVSNIACPNPARRKAAATTRGACPRRLCRPPGHSRTARPRPFGSRRGTKNSQLFCCQSQKHYLCMMQAVSDGGGGGNGPGGPPARLMQVDGRQHRP